MHNVSQAAQLVGTGTDEQRPLYISPRLAQGLLLCLRHGLLALHPRSAPRLFHARFGPLNEPEPDESSAPRRSPEHTDAPRPSTPRMLSSTTILAILAPTTAYQLGLSRAPTRASSARVPSIVAAEKHATVIFLRHGQSEWNAASLFTGWADVCDRARTWQPPSCTRLSPHTG